MFIIYCYSLYYCFIDAYNVSNIVLMRIFPYYLFIYSFIYSLNNYSFSSIDFMQTGLPVSLTALTRTAFSNIVGSWRGLCDDVCQIFKQLEAVPMHDA